MTSPFQSRWSLDDIDDIEQTIYMLNRPSSEDSMDAENFGWNSPIKYHRFASTPGASGKKLKPLGQLPISAKKSLSPRNDPKTLNQNLRLRQPQFAPSSLELLLNSSDTNIDEVDQENLNFNHRKELSVRKPSFQTKLSGDSHNTSLMTQNVSQLSAIDYEEFLANAKKHLEFELARERNDAVVKLKQILSEGAKSHVEQKRRDVVNRLVGQTDIILQKAQYEILTEAVDLFGLSNQQFPPPPQERVATSHYQESNQKIKFREILKRIKVAEQEKIKQRVQQGVQHVASQLIREEALAMERRQSNEIVSRSLDIYSANLDSFSVSRGKLSRLTNCSPNDYLQHQLAVQKRLQDELKQLKEAAPTI